MCWKGKRCSIQKPNQLILVWLFLLALNGIMEATPLDLSTWNVVQYDFTGFQPAANWVLSNDNKTVTQTVNADPSMLLNGIDQTSYQIKGSVRVATSFDDDLIGFVFGYQDPSHFYLMDWKQTYQNSIAGIAQEGFSIKKFSANQKSDFIIEEFWQSASTTHMTNLVNSYGSNRGWADNTLYDFYLNFQPGIFDIEVALGNAILWDVTVTDNSYTSGQFGFYMISQSSVEYSGFEQKGGAVVPEPSTFCLIGIGLIGLVVFCKKSGHIRVK